MTELDELYLRILGSGLSSIRNTPPGGDWEYCAREAEHLHEIPNLIGLANLGPHLYYFTKMRVAYMEWVSRSNRERIRNFVESWYVPVWEQMNEILESMNRESIVEA